MDPHYGPTGSQLTAGYLDFFEPDVYVETSPKLAVSAGLGKIEQESGQPRVLPLHEFVQAQNPEGFDFAFGLNIFHIYQHLYGRQFQFVLRQAQDGLFEEPDLRHGQRGAAAFFEVTFGAFPDIEDLSYLPHAFRSVFDPIRLKPTANDWLDTIENKRTTPLHLTRHLIDPHYPWSRDATIFVIDPSNPFDLIDLWNLRLYRPYVVPVNANWISEATAFLRRFVDDNYRPLPGNPHGAMTRTLIQFGRSIPEDRAEAIRTEVLDGVPKESWSWSHNYDNIWEDMCDDGHVVPHRALLSAGTSSLEFPASGDDAVRLRFVARSPEFAPRFGAGSICWINVLALRDIGNQSHHAVFAPTSLQDPHLSTFRIGGRLLISREGFVLPQQFTDHQELLELPTGRVAITDWLQRRGIEASPSDPGRIADEILLAIDGFRGARILADKGTLELLDKMAKSVRLVPGKHEGDAARIEEYPDRTCSVGEWRTLLKQRASTQALGRAPELDDFIRAGALQLGLIVKCVNCEKQNWYSLRDLDTHVVCARCLSTYRFPQGKLNFKQTPWHFRVTGPFSVPNFAGGAYATVLALRAFATTLSHADSSVVFSTNLGMRPAGESFEIDFAFWYRRERELSRWDEPLFVAGEAKSFAEEGFKDADIRRLRRLATSLPGTTLVLATMKDGLSDSEKARVAELALWGRTPTRNGHLRAPVVVLTSTELFAEHTVQDAWVRRGGEHAKLVQPAIVRLDNLKTLADVTQKVYLGIS